MVRIEGHPKRLPELESKGRAPRWLQVDGHGLCIHPTVSPQHPNGRFDVITIEPCSYPDATSCEDEVRGVLVERDVAGMGGLHAEPDGEMGLPDSDSYFK